jgi:hypothetical protein
MLAIVNQSNTEFWRELESRIILSAMPVSMHGWALIILFKL